MPTSRYHHGNLREALVSEAVVVARDAGPEGLRIRDLARRVGVSHNAAYGHFAHRDDLVAAVADQAMAQLVAAARARFEQVRADDPVTAARQRLAAVGRAYVDFAVTHPGLFRVAFTSTPRVQHGSGDDLYRILSAVLDELVEVGFLAPEEREGAEATCWSTVHGFATLVLDGPLSDLSETERARCLDRALTAIDRSYAATTGTNVAASRSLLS